MRIRLILSAVLIGMLSMSAAGAAADVASADAGWGNAPDFTMTTFEGKEVHLSDYAGKPLILNFWAEWCPPCVAEMPLLEEAWLEYGADVQFMTVNLEKGRMDPATFLEQRGITIPGALADNEVGQQYGISGIPATFFISSEGNVLGMKTGAFMEDELPYALDVLLDYEHQLMVTD